MNFIERDFRSKGRDKSFKHVLHKILKKEKCKQLFLSKSQKCLINYTNRCFSLKNKVIFIDFI